MNISSSKCLKQLFRHEIYHFTIVFTAYDLAFTCTNAILLLLFHIESICMALEDDPGYATITTMQRMACLAPNTHAMYARAKRTLLLCRLGLYLPLSSGHFSSTLLADKESNSNSWPKKIWQRRYSRSYSVYRGGAETGTSKVSELL